MQYGLEVSEYRRVDKDINKEINLKEQPIILIGMLLSGILISRVVLVFNQGNIIGIAPFGLAYLIAVIMKKDERKSFMACIGVIIGYITVAESLLDSYSNILSVVTISIYSIYSMKMSKRIREIAIFTLILFSYILYGFIFNGYDLGVNITIALINTVIVLPIYYVIRYGINCIEEFNTCYFFSTEEIISMGIVLCLIVAGLGDIGILGISIRAVLSYVIILAISYVGGGAYGSAIGVAMGIIVGMSTENMTLSITLYGIAGLISGIFKDTGKLFSFLSYLIMFLGLSLYSQSLNIAGIGEVLIAGIIFMILPKRIFEMVSVEVNSDIKRDKLNELELNELKRQFSDKVEELGDALLSVSNTLVNIGDNEKLMYKNKSTALIENLADRVCSNCDKCKKCWGKEFNLTYNSFQRLINSCEENKVVFPAQLEKSCYRKFDLIKGAERIVDNLNNNEIIKERLGEGRVLLANHIKNLSSSIDEMLGDFKRDVTICGDLERNVRRALSKGGIKYKNVFCYRDIAGREKIKITLENCGGGKYCSRNILPIINDVVSNPMSISSEGCRINPDNDECYITFEESPKYYMVSYGAISTKEGEEYTGDTYSFGKTKDGCYMTLISDGMGSGPDAGKESKATVEVMERFIGAGFDKETAINMMNSIMSMKFEEDEKFSTLDLNLVDLYSGEASFAKVGAVASFVKRGEKVKPIVSNMPPFGLVDNVELEEVKMNVKNGDIIVLLSDGVVDVDKDSIGKFNWIEDYLRTASKDPKQLVGDIIDRAKELSGGKANDDMTVVVSKVYSMY